MSPHRSFPDTRSAGTVLVVDDQAPTRRLLERLLVSDGHVVFQAANGREALDAVRDGSPDVVVMDVRMPGLDGFEACRSLKQDPATRLIPVVLMTGSTDRDDRLQAIEVGADDFLTKPIDEAELTARLRSLVRLKRHTDDLESAEAVILSLAMTIEARDPSTHGHCERLAAYSVAIGRRLALPDVDLAALHRGGYLHDIGKIVVPDAILGKRGALTLEERAVIREHPLVGERLCGTLRSLQAVRPIIRHHHERLDGSGYPDGLQGHDIPLLAQIVGVADVFDALTTVRPYKAAWPMHRAVETLRADVAGGKLRADLVDLLVAAVEAGDVAGPPGQRAES